MNVIGLTGGIATGKSTVAKRAHLHGVPVLDADRLAREVVARGQPALQALVEALGSGILTLDGELDRPTMRDRITREPETKQILESVTHPAIRAKMVESLRLLAQQGHAIAIVEAALLVETGSHRLYPTLWVVACSPEVQLERVMSRDQMSEPSARALIATQLNMDAKRAVATVVFENNGTLEQLHQDVDEQLIKLGVHVQVTDPPL